VPIKLNRLLPSSCQDHPCSPEDHAGKVVTGAAVGQVLLGEEREVHDPSGFPAPRPAVPYIVDGDAPAHGHGIEAIGERSFDDLELPLVDDRPWHDDREVYLRRGGPAPDEETLVDGEGPLRQG